MASESKIETPEEQVTSVHRHKEKYSINQKLTKIHYQQSLTQAFIFGKTNWTIKSWWRAWGSNYCVTLLTPTTYSTPFCSRLIDSWHFKHVNVYKVGRFTHCHKNKSLKKSRFLICWNAELLSLPLYITNSLSVETWIRPLQPALSVGFPEIWRLAATLVFSMWDDIPHSSIEFFPLRQAINVDDMWPEKVYLLALRVNVLSDGEDREALRLRQSRGVYMLDLDLKARTGVRKGLLGIFVGFRTHFIT